MLTQQPPGSTMACWQEVPDTRAFYLNDSGRSIEIQRISDGALLGWVWPNGDMWSAKLPGHRSKVRTFGLRVQAVRFVAGVTA